MNPIPSWVILILVLAPALVLVLVLVLVLILNGGTAIQAPLAPVGRGDRHRPTSQGRIGTKDPVITRTKVIPLGGRQIGGAHTVACMCPGQGTNQVLVPLRPEDFAQQAVPLPVPS